MISFLNPNEDVRGRVEEEIDLLLEGGAQRLWRMSGKTVEGYWEKLQLHYVVALSEVLLGIPASSSDVERRFADQSKIHVKSRKCLKEETVSVLMNLRAAQKAVLRKRGWAAVPTDEFNSDVLEAIIALEVQGQIEHDAKGLKVGDQVIVHFFVNGSPITRQKKKAYGCTLVKKIGTSWQVDWDDGGDQQFVPAVDEWEKKL